MTADFVPFVYYEVSYYYQINKVLRTLCYTVHTEIIYDQNASKNVKNISIDGEVISKIKK